MMSLIRSAVLRLTLFYLAIIMVISLCFSVVIYNLSSHELNRASAPQALQQFRGFFVDDYLAAQQALIDESRSQIKRTLVLWNLVIVGLGAFGSYVFARRTLQPIDDAIERQGRFISDASHELRTPLTAIQTETEVGLRDPKLTLKEAKELLASNLEEAKRLGALTTGLLELSNGQQTMQLEPVALSEVLSRAVSQIEPARSSAGITIVQQDIASVSVLGSPQRLEELFLILLDNAIKYSPSGSEIALEAKKQGKYAVIVVRDQGMGIKAGDLPHIFDRFYRADASRSKQHIDGHGLGLSIAKQIIDAHGGQIVASSKPGHGATFTVKLLLA